MDSGYTGEIPANQTLAVPAGSTATSFEIDGTLIVAGTLTASEVGNSTVIAGGPPYGYDPGPLPVTGTLVIENGGSASNIGVRDEGSVDVQSGGVLTNFGGIPDPDGGYPDIYGGAQVTIEKGATASNGNLGGGYLTVAGNATDLTTAGEQITISGSVSGLTAQQDGYPDHGGFSDVTTVQDGGKLLDSMLSGPGVLVTQLGATASAIALDGFLDSGLSPNSPAPTGGETLLEQAASTITDLTATGGSFSYLEGYTGDLTVAAQAAVFVGGGLAGADVTGGDRDVYQFLGIPVEDAVPSGEASVNLNYETFQGLDIVSGGHALGVIDDGLMAVESGGQATDVDVQATLGVFTGGTAVDATLDAGSQTLLGGRLVYVGSGTTVDKGAILSTTLSDAGSGQTPVITESFTTGQVVQNGTGTLVLDAFNTFGGGIVIENGTVELAAANAAGAGGGVRFVEPASGTPVLETLKLDPAFAGAVSGATTEYFPGVSGFGLGTVVDLTGQAFQRGDTVSVIDGGTALALEGPKGALHDTISVSSGATNGMQFLSFGDGTNGTDIIALPMAALAAAAQTAGAEFGSGSALAIITKAVDALSSSSLKASPLLANFGLQPVGQVASFLQAEVKADPTAAVTALRDLFSSPATQALARGA